MKKKGKGKSVMVGKVEYVFVMINLKNREKKDRVDIEERKLFRERVMLEYNEKKYEVGSQW